MLNILGDGFCGPDAVVQMFSNKISEIVAAV